MPYKIRNCEEFGEAFERILREESGRAILESTSEDPPSQRAIHQLRKRCKRARGLIALYRQALGTVATEADRQIRHYSRSLAAARSEQALTEIAQRFHIPFVETGTDRTVPSPPQDVPRIASVLESVASLCGPPARNTSRNDLLRGLARIAKKSKRAWKVAADAPTTANLHRWRTRAKSHWYAVRLTQKRFPGPSGLLRRQLARLGEGLGIHHDLSIILDRLTADGIPDQHPERRRIRRLRKRIARRMLKLGFRVHGRPGKSSSRSSRSDH